MTNHTISVLIIQRQPGLLSGLSLLSAVLYWIFPLNWRLPAPGHAGIQLKSLVVQAFEQPLVARFPMGEHFKDFFRFAFNL